MDYFRTLDKSSCVPPFSAAKSPSLSTLTEESAQTSHSRSNKGTTPNMNGKKLITIIIVFNHLGQIFPLQPNFYVWRKLCLKLYYFGNHCFGNCLARKHQTFSKHEKWMEILNQANYFFFFNHSMFNLWIMNSVIWLLSFEWPAFQP